MSFPDITEFAAGEHPRAYDHSHPRSAQSNPFTAELAEARVFIPDITEFASRKSSCIKRENLSGLWVELKDFSLIHKIFSKLCSRMIFASFIQDKEGKK